MKDLEAKLLHFADDTTAVLSDLNSANALFRLLHELEKASGLKLNVKKKKKKNRKMWIGSLKPVVKSNHSESNGTELILNYLGLI